MADTPELTPEQIKRKTVELEALAVAQEANNKARRDGTITQEEYIEATLRNKDAQKGA